MKLPAFSLLAVLLAGASTGLQAQSAPSTEQMIEQLRPAAKTRSLRNLIVEQPQAPAAQPAAGEPGTPATPATTAVAAVPAPPPAGLPEPRPSLSLQIQFAFDSTEVQSESRQALENLARALQSADLATSRFAIEGHTDAKGRADYNLRLSQRRADAVRAVLAQQGVDASRLVTQGKGAAEPADPQDPFAAVNRRVRVVNLD